ncbi:MAG TPA: hypothetical protein VHC49_11550, partial [Mycobacteriales bacterium]|nr:hypothetical protein [Mycobacteriales bacterium]
VDGSTIHAGVFRIADGTATMPEQALPMPAIADSSTLRIHYAAGVLAIGDDQHYAVYADPVGS